MRCSRFCGIAAAMLLFLSGCTGTEAGNPAEVPSQSGGIQENNSTASETALPSEADAAASGTSSASGSGTADEGASPSAGWAVASKPKTTATPAPEEPFTPYEAPEYAGSSFHADLAEGDQNVQLDLSAVSQGYIGVSVKSETRVKMKVIKGDISYQHNVASDGTPSIFPLQSGDGQYTFEIYHVVEGTGGKYARIYQATKNVTLEDEFQPFLRPSDYVNYNENSKCVKKAAELAAKEEDALGVVTAIFNYICKNIDYDNEKAIEVQTNKTYLPDPDEIMESGKGICYDYAALAAAMLRSQGIPTKMVHGFVSSGDKDVYHAWNLFYTEETGWVAVEYAVKSGDWTRLDITFSAGGADSEFIGDGGNYTDTKYF